MTSQEKRTLDKAIAAVQELRNVGGDVRPIGHMLGQLLNWRIPTRLHPQTRAKVRELAQALDVTLIEGHR